MKKIVILGGGPAGLALAMSFIKNKYLVTVIEKGNFKNYRHGEHVSSEILNLFNSLGIPSSLLINNSIRCNGIVGFWAGKEIINQGLFNKNGYDFILNRPAFDFSIHRYAESTGVKFYLEAKHIKVTENLVTLNNNLHLKFDYIFDCTGRTSTYHCNTRLVFDNLIGITYELPNNGGNTNDTEIIIDSTEKGWWYSINVRRSSICTFFTDNDIYRSKNFDLNLELSSTKILKDKHKRLAGNLHIMPCYTSVLKRTPNKIFQVGDAFSSYDPLSSLGIYKAFENAIVISETFEKNNQDLTNAYEKFQMNFLKYIGMRNEFYNNAYLYFGTDFYKRRVLT